MRKLVIFCLIAIIVGGVLGFVCAGCTTDGPVKIIDKFTTSTKNGIVVYHVVAKISEDKFQSYSVDIGEYYRAVIGDRIILNYLNKE
jgi:hypothetical protein